MGRVRSGLAERGRIGGKGGDRLLFSLIQNNEILLLQSFDRLTLLVMHYHVDLNEPRRCFQDWGSLPARRVSGRCLCSNRGSARGQQKEQDKRDKSPILEG